ncbi:MAG: peptidoglycan DD-metalloendopeptidase family protein [Defluviitaleaceae bacterium]|nr:peptidoglycan DD-metalloendopeptidase family protein [Defluviitaleaceae bacterium]
MAEKPKNVKARGKGFYVAMYSALGGLLVLAVAIGYYSLIGTGSGDDSGFNTAEITLPVGGTQDVPVVQVPTQTTPSVPQNTTPQRDDNGTIQSGVPQEPEVPPSTAPQTEPQQGEQPTAYEPDIAQEAEFVPYEEALVPSGPSFTAFNTGDDMHWPILGEIVMDFSPESHIFDITMDQWRTNDSISIRASRGDAVRAAASGVVMEVTPTARDGHTVVINHGNGWLTTYRQLDAESVVAIGDVVSRGQIIGNVGAPSIFTAALGYHVGFNVQNDGTAINPHSILSTTN